MLPLFALVSMMWHSLIAPLNCSPWTATSAFQNAGLQVLRSTAAVMQTFFFFEKQDISVSK